MGCVHTCVVPADKEELVAKIHHLEQRLNDRKEALLEKELILEEVTRLSDKLRVQVSHACLFICSLCNALTLEVMVLVGGVKGCAGGEYKILSVHLATHDDG